MSELSGFGEAPMSLVQWQNEQSQNYMCSVLHIIYGIMCEGLRKVFKQEWNARYQESYGGWDDTNVSGIVLFRLEIGRPRSNKNMYQEIFQHGDTSEWDFLVLVDAIINSNSIGRSGLNRTIQSEVCNLKNIRNRIVDAAEAGLSEAEFQMMIYDVGQAFISLGLPNDDLEQINLQRNRGTSALTQKKMYININVNKRSQDADDESKMFYHFDPESSKAGNRNLDNDLDSQRNRISEEAFQLDLEDEKSSPLSPNFEINVKNLETRNTKGNEKCSELVDASSQTSMNPSGKFEDRSLKQKPKLKRDPGNKSTTQGIDVVYVKYPVAERRMKSEMLKSFENEECALKSRSSILFPERPAPVLSLRVKELEEEIAFLKNETKSLQAKYEDTLADLGRIDVQKTAKENEERKFQLFQQIYRPPLSGATVLPTSKDRPINHMNGSLNRFLKRHPTNERADAQAVSYPATSAEQHVEGAEALVQRSNHQPRKAEIVTSDKNESEIQRGDRQSTEISTIKDSNENQTQNSSSNNTSREKTSGGEGINQSGKVQGARGLALTSRQSYENLSLSVQQDDSGTEYISLGNVPPTSVATTLYNNYKLLLLSLGQRLLSCDVVKLKDWASQNFSIDNPQNATDILFQLDQKAVINASDLSQLCHFFESIVRVDLVYIIDAFLLGDYSKLRQTSAIKQQASNAAQTSQYHSTTMYQSMLNAMNTGRQSLVNPAASGTLQTNPRRNATTLRKPGNGNGTQRSVPQQTQLAAFRNVPDTANPARCPRSPNETQSTASEQQNLQPATTGFTPTRMADVVVADGSSVTNERRTMAGNYLTRSNPSVTNPRNAQAVGSNGSKHSKFQRPDADRSNISNFQSPAGSRNQYLDREDNWLCSHYKRHCYVKFECCDSFWPCHRCHNNQSTCGRKKLKSRDTQMLKCVYCNKVQQFGHSCCDCGAKFSAYYCGLCKHLTGKDDNPYHCVKCGICRIHGDRSFHCDVCGVCLDVQLRGNHKCREGSAHDECCICLEDAFTGCQILPCSHKVHKECATQMIRSGITRCPICRESFAHKLERQPLPNSRKRAGK